MTAGLSAAQAAAILNIYRATNITAPANVYLKLHTGDPGAAGTANASAETTRKVLAFAVPSAGSSAATVVTWAAWTAGSETITHVSIWDNLTAGSFLQSGALSASQAVVNTNTLNVTVTAAYTPIAA